MIVMRPRRSSMSSLSDMTGKSIPARGGRCDWRDARASTRAGIALLFLAIWSLASFARADDYFPSPESQGGWRKLEDPNEIRTLTQTDPAKLEELKEWLLKSDSRNFAAVVVRHGYIVLEVEWGNSSKTDSRRIASCSKEVGATALG